MDNLIAKSGNRIDDVRWLCSLTESEIDFLISLKVLIIERAKKIGGCGGEALAKKFDLKFLRALSFIFMNQLKGKLEGLPITRGSDESPLELCNLLNPDLDENFESLSIEELSPYFCSDKRKRFMSTLSEDMSFQSEEEN